MKRTCTNIYIYVINLVSGKTRRKCSNRSKFAQFVLKLPCNFMMSTHIGESITYMSIKTACLSKDWQRDDWGKLGQIMFKVVTN